SLLEDEKRHWSPALLCYELERRGFEPVLRIVIDRYVRPLADILKEAERRDVSQIAILPDDLYARGLARLRRDLDADLTARVPTDHATFVCTARRAQAAGSRV